MLELTETFKSEEATKATMTLKKAMPMEWFRKDCTQGGTKENFRKTG